MMAVSIFAAAAAINHFLVHDFVKNGFASVSDSDLVLFPSIFH
jgi:hypothetical protein